MRRLPFRTLIIDDDVKMLNGLTSRLKGTRATARRRMLYPSIDLLEIEVEFQDGRYCFTEDTLRRVLETSRRRYDYIILDYSYASRNRQVVQWNEDGTGNVPSSNEHLLTILDLYEAAIKYSRTLGGQATRDVSGFFEQKTRVLLRSFQHDRARDILGTYAHRLESTRGVFRNSETIDALDGFAIIYDSEPELRESLYQRAPRGRELYRNVVTALTVKYFERAMYTRLAHVLSRGLIARTAASLSAIIVAVAALSTFVQALVGPLLAALRTNEWQQVAVISALTVLGVFGGSLIVAWFGERGIRGVLSGSAEDDQ